METYATKNLYLACFLRVRGYEIVDLERYSGKVHFVMKDKPERADDVKSYYSSAEVIATDFAKALTELKSMIYDWKPKKPTEKPKEQS